ncbi:MAG: hypothetical protein ACR2FL_08285 [Nocardioidaceae bacterium]
MKLLPASPQTRTMALATLVYTVGNGMFMVVSVLYFTRIVGLGQPRWAWASRLPASSDCLRAFRSAISVTASDRARC